MRKLYKIIASRFFISAFLILLEIAIVVGFSLYLVNYYVYFGVLATIVDVLVFLHIINTDTNPDHKIPWIGVVLLIPFVGAIIFFMFGKPKISRKDRRFFNKLSNEKNSQKINNDALNKLIQEDQKIGQIARALIKDTKNPMHQKTTSKYYENGLDYLNDLLVDLKNADSFIFLEFFIIKSGYMWDSILTILKEKVDQGIKVRVLYDDIGCVKTLPSRYYKTLQAWGIESVPFAKFTANANASHNNRSHRKMVIIDGKIGYTGGLNISDEYINRVQKFGYWKDTGVRLEGEAVVNFTSMFLFNWDLAHKRASNHQLYLNKTFSMDDYQGYYAVFGDGPSPYYKSEITKMLLMSLFYQAKKHIRIMSPYFIIDKELTNALINACKRGIQVEIILPGIPDKKIIHLMGRSSYLYVIKNGVKIYEFTPGFMHAKNIVIDDDHAICGTINMDYRSLVHHFENAVWMVKTPIIEQMKLDFINVLAQSNEISESRARLPLVRRILAGLLRIFAPLL